MTGTSGSESEQCEELFCEKDARWIFEGPACEPTPLCDDHAIEFPNDRLRKADDVHRADGGQTGNPHWQQCEMPDCTTEVPTAKAICDECAGVGGGRDV